MCELLATTALFGRPLDGSAAFTVGMVAGLEALLGCDLSSIVAELPVDEEVEAAVLTQGGPLGAVLTDVLAYEAGLPPRLIDVVGLRSVFLASLTWAAPLVVVTPA
jgi:c-di-GMP-related signal transduction protein